MMLARVGSRVINALTKFQRVSSPSLKKFGASVSVEMAPPSLGELMTSIKSLDAAGGMAKLPEMTLNEIGARGLVLVEILLWFKVGEMIGRGSIIGYNPPLE